MPSGRIGRWCSGAISCLALAGSPCAAQRPSPRTPGTPGTIGGRVVDSLLQNVPGAAVTLDSTARTVHADSTGEFRLAGVAPGLHAITIQRLGFLPGHYLIPVTPGNATYWTYTLARPPTALPTVTSSVVGAFGKPQRLDYTMKYDAFYERRMYSIGGRFYTHEDLKRMKVQDFVEVLRRIPHFKIVHDADGTTLSFPTCKNTGILIELDSHRIWPPGDVERSDLVMEPPTLAGASPGRGGGGDAGAVKVDPLDYLSSLTVNNVEAVEVYPTSSALPAEAVGDACAAIFVWTR
jgi:Carboxypeptidase regulatory-like domain